MTLAALAGTLMSCQPGITVRQFLESKECQDLDSNASCQQNTGD